MNHCRDCGERLGSDSYRHTCAPNDTGLQLDDLVRVGEATGRVVRISRASAEVYFRAGFRSQWYPATALELVAS